MSTIPEAKFRTFMAEMVHLYVHQVLADYPALLEHAKFKEIVSASANDLVMQITTWCLSGRVPSRTETETIEWPDGVWQTLKHNHLPHWFVRRFPVRMTSRVITTATYHYFVCPHLVTDPNNWHVQFMATGSDLAREFHK